MADELIVRGRYVDHRVIPDGTLPDIEGTASLIITPSSSKPGGSIFDLFGKASVLLSAEQIQKQIAQDRNEWSES